MCVYAGEIECDKMCAVSRDDVAAALDMDGFI